MNATILLAKYLISERQRTADADRQRRDMRSKPARPKRAKQAEVEATTYVTGDDSWMPRLRGYPIDARLAAATRE